MEAIVEQSLQSVFEWLTVSDDREVKQYIAKIRSEHPALGRREIAQKIVDEHSINSALWGAVTGVGGFFILPVVLPLDIFKAWKIQGFVIQCIACLYGHTPQKTDLKTAILLLMTTGSVEELKQHIVVEGVQVVGNHTLNAIDALKASTIQIVAKEGTKYTFKVLTKCGEQILIQVGAKELSKFLMTWFCKIGSRKIVEKIFETCVGLAAPVAGGVIGSGVDWTTTQAVGRLAIEFFEQSSAGYRTL